MHRLWDRLAKAAQGLSAEVVRPCGTGCIYDAPGLEAGRLYQYQEKRRPVFVTIKRASTDTNEIVAYRKLLGLTVQCAKCPSHKYDPVPRDDYIA